MEEKVRTKESKLQTKESKLQTKESKDADESTSQIEPLSSEVGGQREVKQTEKNMKREKEERSEIRGADQVFQRAILTRKISLSIMEVGDSLKENIEMKIRNLCEGKCIQEGYVRLNSAGVLTYSCGILQRNIVNYEVTFECEICLPVEGMLVECYSKNVTMAGIRAELYSDVSLQYSTPLMIFVARDHHYNNENDISKIKENEKIVVKILGVRYELNDTYISIIAEYIPENLLK